MFAYQEYLVLAHCPYCNRELSTIIGDLNRPMIYQCSDCGRGLSILPFPTMKALIEPGTVNQVSIDIIPLKNGCCGHA